MTDANWAEERKTMHQRIREKGMEKEIAKRQLNDEDAEKYRKVQRFLWLVEEDMSPLVEKAVKLLPKEERERYSNLEEKKLDLEGELLLLCVKKTADKDFLPQPPPHLIS